MKIATARNWLVLMVLLLPMAYLGLVLFGYRVGRIPWQDLSEATDWIIATYRTLWGLVFGFVVATAVCGLSDRPSRYASSVLVFTFVYCAYYR